MSNSYWDFNYANRVYQYLYADIGNHYGVSGLLGNIYAESHICPFVCEGDRSSGYTDSYAATMNTIRNLSDYDFQRYHLSYSSSGQVGYSLAQWTTYSRKSAYYQYCTQSLLGDETKSMEFLLRELQQSYPSVYNVLVNATSINQASDYVLQYYEAPASWQSKIQERRGYSTNVYDDFSGLPPIPGMSLPIWLLKKLADNNRI